MKFIITSEKLSLEVGRMQSILSRKVPLPILENILITSVGENTIELVTTNLETTLRNVVTVEKIEEEGQMLVQAQQLNVKSRLLPTGLATISSDENNWITLQANRTKFRIPGADPEEFPSTPRLSKAAEISFPAKLIKKMIGGVAFVIPPEDDKRYAMKGAKFESDLDGVRMIATDGHRVALAAAQNDEFQSEDLDVLIPEKGLEDLVKLTSDAEAVVVKMIIEGNNMFFQEDQRLLVVRLLDGKFPGYAPVIENAREGATVIPFKVNELAQSLRRARSSEDSATNAVLFEFANSELKLTARTSRQGSAEEVMEDVQFAPEKPILINLNSKYLSEYLASVDGADLSFGLKDGESPVYLRAVKDDIGFACVVQSMDPPEND